VTFLKVHIRILQNAATIFSIHLIANITQLDHGKNGSLAQLKYRKGKFGSNMLFNVVTL
jgi:hypothetical protein